VTAKPALFEMRTNGGAEPKGLSGKALKDARGDGARSLAAEAAPSFFVDERRHIVTQRCRGGTHDRDK